MSVSSADPSQKLQFGQAGYFDAKEWVWKSLFFVLPAQWNAYQDGCDADWCWGRIQMPSGATFKWAEGLLVGSALDDPAGDFVWRRSNNQPAFEYGLVRRGPNRQDLVIDIDGVIFTAEQPTDETMQQVLSFVRSFSSTPSPCRDCVRPVSRTPITR